ncbi:MAG: hypothetical protein FJ271_13750 [Planctomycetes bacterium]|nr:hypothetical protein [Planctomycetota bacterium]
MATVTSPKRTIDRADTDRRVRHPLQALRGYIRSYVTLEGAFVALIYVALWFWIGLALDYGIFKLTNGFDWVKELQDLSPGDRTADWIVRGVILGMLLAGLLALVAFKVFMRWFREFRDPALALVLERRFPHELGDRLITAVEMADPKLAGKYGYSQALVDKTIVDAAERVEQIPVKQVFNWGRLRKLAGLVLAVSVGMYLLVGGGYLGINAAFGGSASVGDYFWRFQHTAAIWVERNILLQDSYWPRQAYLELVRFQDTKEHPGEMRIGRDESRPDLQVRAFQWVVADHSSQAAKTGGWRPLTWNDLPGFVDAALLGRVTIPAHWGGWQMDLGDLDSDVPAGVIPSVWQGKSAGAVRTELATAELKKATAGFEVLVADWLDWQRWTVDRLGSQANIEVVRRNLRAEHPEAQKALDDVFARIEELAGDVTMERKIRKLALPKFASEDPAEQIVFYYWGKNTKITTGPDRSGASNSFIFGLGDLKESVEFTIQALDYSTPVLKIQLVPPPGVTSVHVDKEEPAYLFYRLQGDQRPLKGKKQIFKNVPVSVTGEASIVQIPIGANMTLYAEADRPLKDSVRMTRPAQTEERGAITPIQKVQLADDQKTFSVSFKNVVKTIEFYFEFTDRDNVGGKRRIVIRPIDDRAPEVFDVEMLAGLRKPRFRTDPGKSSQGTAADGFLITPDALVPFKGTLRDDYGLTQANWHFDVEPIDFELVSKGDKEKLPQLVLQGNAQLRRLGLVVSGLSTHGFPGTDAIYWAWVNRMVAVDLAISGKRYNEEGAVPLERFQVRLEERGAEELTLNALLEKLKEKPPQRALFREHTLKDEDGFDFKKYLPKLKVADATKEAQLHYQVRLSVSATDNNIETGPSVGKNKAPFTFLVVSESELLAQIFLEEESIRDRLDKAIGKLKNGRTAISEQLGKLSSPATDLALVNIRVEEVRKVVSDTGSTSREIHSDFSRILKELEVNRVGYTRGKQKINDVRDKIVEPMELIINPNFGSFMQTEERLSALAKGLEDDTAALRQAEADKSVQATRLKLQANIPTHVKNTQLTRDRLDDLIEKLNSVYLAMEEGVVFGQLLQTIVRIEQDQRKIRDDWRIQHEKKVKELFGELTK